MCVHSREPRYWYDLDRSHLQGRAAALLRAESAGRQVPQQTWRMPSHTLGQLAPFAGPPWKGWETSKPWGCRNCFTADTQRMERNFSSLFNRALGALWPFCGQFKGNHLVPKKLVKSRWRRLQIYYSIALRYRKGNSPLSGRSTQGLCTRIPYALKISTQQHSCTWATGAL